MEFSLQRLGLKYTVTDVTKMNMAAPVFQSAQRLRLSAHDLKFVPQSLSGLRGTVASAGVRQYATKNLRRRRLASMTSCCVPFSSFPHLLIIMY